jgi:phosphoribosylglycinamide formyltransferase 1
MSLTLAILVSGKGSNMVAIMDAIESGSLDANIAVVMSNNPEAPALATARARAVHAVAVSNRGLTREAHEKLVLAELCKHKLDIVVLAGYMRVLTSEFLNNFRHPQGYFRVVNIHPSLLPAFPGAAAYEEAFDAGLQQSGISIHLVDEQVDHGMILAQESFPRLPDDTLETFRARGLAVEHRLYPQVLQRIARDGISEWKTNKTEATANSVKKASRELI